jgi:glutaredoxin
MSNKVLVFTLNGCGHCVDLKKELTQREIPFIEIEVSNNQKIWDQVVNQTGHNILPTIFIKRENTDDGLVYVPGKDFHNTEEAVEIVKKYV